MKTMAGANVPRRLKALLCASERSYARLVQVNLERSGFAVTCVFDGQDAVNALEELNIEGLKSVFQLAVLDLKLRKLSGLEVLGWIREHDHTRQLQVVMTVDTDEERDEVEQWPYHVNNCLVKPFHPGDLLR